LVRVANAEEYADGRVGETLRDLESAAIRTYLLACQNVHKRGRSIFWQMKYRIPALISREVMTRSRDRDGLSRHAGDDPLIVVGAGESHDVLLE
jgi:hypothetical protein